MQDLDLALITLVVQAAGKRKRTHHLESLDSNDDEVNEGSGDENVAVGAHGQSTSEHEPAQRSKRPRKPRTFGEFLAV